MSEGTESRVKRVIFDLVKGAVFTGASVKIAYALFTSDPSTAELADIFRTIQSESFLQFSLVGGFVWVGWKTLIARS